MKHHVKVTDTALTQMLLNGFEAFVVRHSNNKRRGVEFSASLYGSKSRADNSVHYDVAFISADTSSVMKGGSVLTNPEAVFLKQQLSSAMGYEQLGEMHSHPYLLNEMSLNDVRTSGIHFSQADLNCFTEKLDSIRSDHELSSNTKITILELVLTICQLERMNSKADGRLDDNLIEFSIGNCKCFLMAQVFSSVEEGELQPEPTYLACEHLSSYKHLEVDFGRFVIKNGKKRVVFYRKNATV
ncbi:TPA: hypothetical protein QDZ95_003051 [Shewanella algae]|uniref:hypothetical protein n=1 Tax=Shewanella algae TaxID=38313 RepID=UPI001C5A097E|nr:hypothetical protein [Shewanella algae]HDS1199527.1 hypothetical protein [Shewanella algae]